MIREEARRLAQDPKEMELLREMANARVDGLIERWEKADTGTLAGTVEMDEIDEQLARLLALDYLSRSQAP